MLSYTFRQDPAVKDKAVLYLRYSSESQTENSIEGQRRECLEFAKKNKIDVLGEYVDRAKTGTNDNRPDFQRMIHDSYTKAFGNVIVWKSDRFSRDRLDALKYKRELFSNGVKVLSVTEPNLDGPMGTLFDSMNDGMNQLYSEELSIKVRRGQRENVLNGKKLGGYLPFGLKAVGDHYEPDENEAPIVQEIFRLYGVDGLSILAISQRLAKQGVRKRNGKPLSHNNIERIITSEKYIGVIKCEGVRNEHAIEPIVSRELFDLCQKRRTKRKHKNYELRAKDEYYLSGKVFCAECGAPYLGESGTSKTGKLHSYYKCNGAKHHRCDARAIKKDDLEDALCALVLTVLADTEEEKEIADYIYGQQRNDAPEVVSMKKRREEVEKQIGNFAKAIGMGIITDTTKSSLLALESEKKQLDDALSKATIRYKNFSKKEIEYALKELANYDYVTSKQKGALLNTFVHQVTISKSGEIVVQLNLFSYVGTAKFTLEDLKRVRINDDFLRQLRCIRTLYVYKYGFGLTLSLPMWLQSRCRKSQKSHS